jgi:hypothetical protein
MRQTARGESSGGECKCFIGYVAGRIEVVNTVVEVVVADSLCDKVRGHEAGSVGRDDMVTGACIFL